MVILKFIHYDISLHFSFYEWITSTIDQLQVGIWDLSHLVITTCTVNKCTELLHKVWLDIAKADNILVSIFN